jgi:alkane 1-monooxygenase
MQRLAPFTSGFGLYLVFMPLAIVWGGFWAWVPIIVTFGIVPLLDVVGGLSLWNPDPEIERSLQADRRFRAIVGLWVPVALALTVWGLYAAAQPSMGWADKIGLVLSIGFMNGVIGITYAHELIHQPSRFEQFLGEVLLVMVSYGHWRVEHVFGHHKNVATPLDPASSRRGESLFAFYPRTVWGTILSSIELERARLVRAGKNPNGPENRIIWYALISLALLAISGIALGPIGALFFIVQSVVAFSSLEVINYIEHYGLARREIAPGKYETTRPKHSWNSGQRISNAMLINLARHSDHHATASRRYQILRTFDDASAPQLPAGYAAMFLLALIPPIWFRVMDSRVDAWNAKIDQAA